MNITCQRKTIFHIKTAFVVTLIFLHPHTLLADGSNASDRSKAPVQLQLVLSPGSMKGKTITFSTDNSTPVVKTSRQPTTVQPTIDTVAKKGLSTEQKTEPEEVDSITPSEEPSQHPSSVNQNILKKDPENNRISIPAYIDFVPEFSVNAGYRRDNLSWAISPFDSNPDTLSKLSWEDLNSFELTTESRWSNASNIYFHGKAGFGWTQNGKVIDSDYGADGEQMEFSRSHSDADGSTLMDASAGFGYRFDIALPPGGGRFQFMPMLGYSIHAQDLRIRNGRQILSAYGFNVDLGPFDGLNSYYGAIWDGAWIGFDLALGFNDKHSLTGSFAYHKVSYDAEADWNLRGNFAHPISFDHSADGDGITASLSYRYNYSDDWFWTFDFDYRNFTTQSGEDITHFSDGTTWVGRLHEVEWNSYSILFGIGFNF